jgi:hypothetical protein
MLNGILRHIYKICFFKFFEPFRPILALKLAKSFNVSKKITYGYFKKQNFTLS